MLSNSSLYYTGNRLKSHPPEEGVRRTGKKDKKFKKGVDKGKMT
jgi:hypothetical protein